MPRDLLKKAKGTAEQLAIRLEPVVMELADRLLLDDPIDMKAAAKLLTDFLQWELEIEENPDLSLANEWFEERSSDEITPVLGDARISFTRAHKTFIQQQLDQDNIVSGFMTTFDFLALLLDRTDPEAIRGAKVLALNFYIKVGERTGNTALEKTGEYLDQFLQNFKASPRP